ncbi:hypothetical protein MTR67_008705 [Solanum verrucosum]|uniref:Uncharacterized protein n=1 Tax=Solanum verrucosum TaxID=315347 RepID=A0AAF0Q4C8_SOLVR|nr:hypothetical protein MTR67_008705 [Solanum verrucosum]
MLVFCKSPSYPHLVHGNISEINGLSSGHFMGLAGSRSIGFWLNARIGHTPPREELSVFSICIKYTLGAEITTGMSASEGSWWIGKIDSLILLISKFREKEWVGDGSDIGMAQWKHLGMYTVKYGYRTLSEMTVKSHSYSWQML